MMATLLLVGVLLLIIGWITPLLAAIPRRERFIVMYFEKGYPYHLILLFLAAVHGIVISMSTLKRILRRLNLRRRGRHSSVNHVGRHIMNELEQSGCLLGYRSMWALLKHKYRVVIPRQVVMEILACIDPQGVALRASRRLLRRRYRSKGPNYLWHMDGNDKLKPYGFPIHGCIDGFSRKILWLEVSVTNNDPSVIAGYYLQVLESLKGCPKIIRSDRGTENCRVAGMQAFLRRGGQDSFAAERSFMYGRSVSNQRIEAFWSVLRRWCLDWWIDFFKMLRDEGHYDNTSPIHVDCLRFAFMDLLQQELNLMVELWNTHIIRPSGAETVSGIPDELFFFPELAGSENYMCDVDAQDLQVCQELAKEKPAPVPIEFLDLVEILMIENNLYIPNTCEAALTLYLDLIDLIQ